MPASLTLLCNLERLAALDEGTGTNLKKLGFGMNLSVGVTDSSRPADNLLQPWKWAKITRVRLQYVPDNGSSAISNDVDVTDQKVSLLPNTDALVQRLQQELDGTATSDLEVPGRSSVIVSSTKASTPGSRPWTPRLLHLSTFPFPIPQSLNLSFLFTIDVSKLVKKVQDLKGRFWAAPILDKGGPFTVTRSPKSYQETSEFVEWTYDPGTPDIKARVAPVQLAPPADKFVDMSNQWVKLPLASPAGEDWQAQLEVRMAEAFRLPDFFADYLRQQSHDPALLNQPTKPGGPTSNLTAVTRTAIAALADCAGVGVLGASLAKGNSLIERLLAATDQSAGGPLYLTQPQLKQLEDLSHQLYPTLESWTKQLTSSIPSLAGCDLLSAAPKSITVAQALAQYQRICDGLFSSTDNANLWKLFADQWNGLLSKSSLSLVDQARVQKAITWNSNQNPKIFDLRLHLGVSNLDRFWQFFVRSNKSKDADGQKLVDDCFGTYLRYYASIRFGLTPPTAGQCQLPNSTDETILKGAFTPAADTAPAALLPGLESLLDARAKDFIDQLRPKSLANDRVPQPVAFALSRIETADNVTGGSDLLEHTSGFLLFMREHGATDQNWHCLNYAETWLAEQPWKTDPVAVPYRPHYRGELKQVFASYNNVAVTADSPLNERSLIQAYYDGTIDFADAFLRFRYCGAANPDNPLPDFVKRPGLKYGRFFDFAASPLTNSGVPAKTTADPQSPWKLAAPIKPDAVPHDAVITVPYQRGIKVGSLRFSAPPKPGDTSNIHRPPELPPIPADVTPRAREYEEFTTAAKEDSPAKAAQTQTPVILLAPKKDVFKGAANSCTFQVRPPTVAWDCWDRWVAADPAIDPKQRYTAIAEVYRQTSAAAKKNSAHPPELQLDDPAVLSKLWFELRKVHDDGTLSGPISPQSPPGNKDKGAWVDLGARGNGPLTSFQRGPAQITCSVADAEDLAAAGTSIQVKVKEGGLYRLDIFSAVPEDTQKRFADGVLPAARPLPGGRFHLTSGSFYLIEVATDVLPSKDDLWGAANLIFQVEGETHRIRADLDPFLLAEDAKGPDLPDQLVPFRYLHRAVALHQAWRWDGRPALPHPELQVDDPLMANKAMQKWEAREFGDRLNVESIPHPMAVLREEKPDVRKNNPLRYASDVRSFRFEFTPRDPKGSYDERGQHHRFAVQVYSRYEGMAGNRESMRTAQESPADDIFNQWKHLYVPCRRKDVLPPPKIKLILPLTQSEPEDPLHSPPFLTDNLKQLEEVEHTHKTAGLLVVLNEPWYETVGIGEGIEARVDLARNPEETPDGPTRTFYFQAGPDPSVNARTFKKDGRLLTHTYAEGDITVNFDPNLIQGPVGHYFDADNTTALFVATSFILPPPTLPEVPDRADKSTPWYYARVAFRRKMDTRIPPDGSGLQQYPDAKWKIIHRYSDFTEPLWVQYLPEFSLYDGFDTHVSGLRLELDKNSKQVKLRDPQGNVRKLTPTQTDNKDDGIFSLYLVLTRMVIDVIGRPDQETYVTTLRARADGAWELLTDGTFPEIDGRYRGRIIEVQRPHLRPPSGGNDKCWNRPSDLWEELFFTSHPDAASSGAAGACDALARIVRISEPIDSKSQITLCEGGE